MSSWSTGYDFSFYGSMVSVGSYMYVAGYDKISRTNLNDGSIDILNWATVLAVRCLATDGNYIYATSNSSPIRYIYKISIVDASKTVFFSDEISPDVSSPFGVAISGDYLYFANSSANYISKISLTNPSTDYNIKWVTSNLIDRPTDLCILNNLIYVTCNSSSYSGGFYVIATINLTTLNLNIIYSNSIERLFGIVSYGNNLYVSAQDYNQLTSRIKQLYLNGTLINNDWATIDTPDGLCIYNKNLYCASGNPDNVPNNSIFKFELPPIPFVCFKEGSKILTNKGYILIQDLKKGDLVKTIKNEYIPIDIIGKKEIYHSALKEDRIKDQLYKLSSSKYPEIFEDLIITGCHSILVSDFKDENEKEKTLKINGDIYITDNKYRLPACVDERADVYEEEGTHNIYHIALENDNNYMNYGIYANGLMVETCSKRYLKELSTMELIE